MTKPTKNQQWWMKAILNGRKVTQSGLMPAKYGSYVFKIHQKSFNSAVKRGYLEFKGGFAIITPAGRKALEG